VSRRQATNPAKVKADIAALAAEAPPEAFQPRLDIRRRPSVALLCVLSSVLLLISFAPFDHPLLAYAALVPWGLAVVGGHSGRWAMLWSFVGGWVFWAAGLYWLSWVTAVGYLAVAPYLACYWLLAGALLRGGFKRGWPTWLTLPVVWVALEYARSWMLSGFTWFDLAHSQYTHLRLIQVADLTGTYGVSFFVAMVNGAIIDALAQPLFVRTRGAGRITRKIAVAWLACGVAWGGLFAYGAWRVGQQTRRPGPRVGVVQLAFPISLVRAGASGQKIFDDHVDNTSPLIGADCDWAVWAESMTGFHDLDPAAWLDVDPDARRRDDPQRPRYSPAERDLIRTYQSNLLTLGRLLRRLGCPLLAGGSMPAIFGGEEDLTCNSALLYDRVGGRLALVERYDKMHLVPFSEYVPFRGGALDWLYRLLRRLVPEAMPQLEPGRREVRFEVEGRRGRFRFAVPICYEGCFARVCRRMVVWRGRKQVDVLVNISNDGWFVYQGPKWLVLGPETTHGSTELPQHLVQYVFRAVENRVPVVRAVNTGISAHIDSVGRTVETVSHAGNRRMVAGTLVAETLVDDRVSPYSLAGDVFAHGVCLAAVVGAVGVLWLRRRQEKSGCRG